MADIISRLDDGSLTKKASSAVNYIGSTICGGTPLKSNYDFSWEEFLLNPPPEYPHWFKNKDNIKGLLKSLGYEVFSDWGIRGYQVLSENFDLNCDSGKIIEYLLPDNQPLFIKLNSQVYLGDYTIAFIKFRKNHSICLGSPGIPEKLMNSNLILDTFKEDLESIFKTQTREYGNN